MRPVVRGLMDKYKGRVEVLILDYDDPAVDVHRAKYRITAHPSFAVISGVGEVVANFVGVVPPDRLEAAVLKALG